MGNSMKSYDLRRISKESILRRLEAHLERTPWGQGVYIPGMVVPAAPRADQSRFPQTL